MEKGDSPLKGDRQKRVPPKRGLSPLLGLLGLAWVLFGLDLFHYGYHLGRDASLLEIPGVLSNLAGKAALFVGLSALFLADLRGLIFICGFSLMLTGIETKASAAMTYESCERAREFLKEAGVARDAKENFFGRMKIIPPRSSFPPEMDKVTWWGAFKPFEFWESPEFNAVWINPSGQAVGRATFRGSHCQLAKTTLPVENLPQRKLEPGIWRVIVSCEDVVIDHHPFAVVGPHVAPIDAGGGQEQGMMIWVDPE